VRIAAVQKHGEPELVVDPDGDHRRLEFDRDLLALIRDGVDPHELTVGAAVEGNSQRRSGRAVNSTSTTMGSFGTSRWSRAT
jgi:hypothetical protein